MKDNSFVVFSDLHSIKDSMNVIKKYIKEGRKVFILGDVTDRGELGDGTGGLDMLLELKSLAESGKITYIPGNHDELLYGYAMKEEDQDLYKNLLIKNGGKQTILDIDNLKEKNHDKYQKLINWLGNLPIQVTLSYNGKTYCLAHALFNQKIYDKNPSFSLKQFYAQKTAIQKDYYTKESNILWFRKGKKSYSPLELPNKDCVMIIGHTPQMKDVKQNFDLKNANGELIKVINVDGGLANLHDYMYIYDSKKDTTDCIELSSYRSHNKDNNIDKKIRFNRESLENNLQIDKIPKKLKVKINHINLSLLRTKNKFILKKDKMSSQTSITKEVYEQFKQDLHSTKEKVVVKIKKPSKKMMMTAGLITTLIVGYHLYQSQNEPIDPGDYTIETKKPIKEDGLNYYIGYKVKENDTLSSIANKHNVALESLLKYNGITEFFVIYPGNTLWIPLLDFENGYSRMEYIIQEGDTLSMIAMQYNIPLEKIIKDNNIKNIDEIKVGATLTLWFNNQDVNKIPADKKRGKIPL